MAHAPLGRWYAYYINKEKARTQRFLALIGSKKQMTLRIRVDSAKFKDDEYRARDLRPWFYKGLNGDEKAFNLASPSEIDKVVPLIRQSYDLVKAERLSERFLN